MTPFEIADRIANLAEKTGPNLADLIRVSARFARTAMDKRYGQLLIQLPGVVESFGEYVDLANAEFNSNSIRVGAGVPVEAGPVRRLFAKRIRQRLAEQLKTNGFGLIGGDATPLPDEKVAELLGTVTDSAILTGAVKVGGFGDGKFLDAIGRFVDWIKDHEEQILAVLKWLLTILAMFA